MKRISAVVWIICCLLVTGCAASSVDVLGKFKAVDGSDITYVRAWARAPMDIDSSVIDRYKTSKGEETRLIASDAGFDGGWGKKTVSMAVPAAIMGGSYVGGSALIRPSNVVQTGGGGSGGTVTNRNVNAQAQGQGQAQGQAQGQIQGQAQGQIQGQGQSLF